MSAGDVPAAHGASKGTILIIDDETGSRKVLKLLLEDEAYEVLTTGDGEEGLVLAKVKHPHVILLDVIMPKMNGYEVLHRLKSDPDTQRIPVIMLTARATEKDIHASFESGAVFHVEKPFETKDLLQKIKVALLEGQAG